MGKRGPKRRPGSTTKEIPEGHVDVHVTIPAEVRDRIRSLWRSEADPAKAAIGLLPTTRKIAYLLSTHPELATHAKA